ncbi:MAG TPA: DUF1573 domain-containing protein [Candidatus Saccharimonadales bacterium]|nr:DUF1573 domain-containing protein [Candidatus Saccharimonadales bacterium]
MKISSILAGLSCAAFLTAFDAAGAASGPQAQFSTKEYVFGKIMAGDVVKYTYVVTNVGDQALEISKVQPSCGCTTAGNWSHRIEPGQTGDIPVQFNSGNFHGDVTKTITVTSNDKLSPMQVLTLKGTIWRQIDVNPQYAYITVVPGEESNATTTIHITNQGDDAVTVSDPRCSHPSFVAVLKTVAAGKSYDLVVRAVPPFANPTTSCNISVKTSLARMPVITVAVYAVSQPALAVAPLQIMLPGLIDRWTTNVVSIMTHTSKPVVLSDPEVNDKRVSVQIKEVVPGRRYTLAAAFPPQYRISPGQRIAVTIKSDNATQPTVTVPVNQLPHPAMHPPAISQARSAPPQ